MIVEFSNRYYSKFDVNLLCSTSPSINSALDSHFLIFQLNSKAMYYRFFVYNSYLFFWECLMIRYASGAAKKIDEILPLNIPIHILNANLLKSPVPITYIAITTKKVDNDVPIDLLIVCHKLSSNT